MKCVILNIFGSFKRKRHKYSIYDIAGGLLSRWHCDKIIILLINLTNSQHVKKIIIMATKGLAEQKIYYYFFF